MKRYKVLIFDADHTVIDYTQDERCALKKLLPRCGITPTEEVLDECNRISSEAWAGAGLNDVHTEYIQREYHNLYHTHTKRIFEGIFRRFPSAADPVKAGAEFARLLEAPGNLCEGAEEVLSALQEKYELCIATNGMTEMQYGRLSKLARYFSKLYISEEMGVIKPLPTFFERIFRDFGRKKEEFLMVGDSLSSDVKGANVSGIDSCWLNRSGMENRSDAKPTYELRSLKELLLIL